MNELKSKWGAKVWAMDHHVDILEHPSAYNLPSSWYAPKWKRTESCTTVRRSLGKEFHCSSFIFTGQIEYEVGLLIEIEREKLQLSYLPGPERVCGGLFNRDRQRKIAVDGNNVFNTGEADFSSPTLTAATC